MKFMQKQAGAPEMPSPKKQIKRSLLQSYLISLMSLCVSVCMLLGTTMAWFTSSVTVPSNEIYVGTLDMDLLLKIGDEFVTLKPDENGAQPKVFGDDIVWFPDHVQVRTLKVQDLGDIPFTYKLTLTPGVDGQGNVLDQDEDDLALPQDELDHFRAQFNVYVKQGEPDRPVDSAQDLVAENGWTLVGNLYELYSRELPVFRGASADLQDPNVTKAAGEPEPPKEAVYTIAVQMNPEYVKLPTDQAEDEPYDFQGYTLNFNIKLVASQTGTPEVVKEEAQLAALLESGYSVTLSGDIDLEQGVSLNYGVLDGIGTHKLAMSDEMEQIYAVTTTGGTIRNLTIQGKGYRESVAIGSGSDGTALLKRNLYIDHVVIDNVQYALLGKGDPTAKCKVVVTNSTISGGILYQNVASLDFVGCTLGESANAYGSMTVSGNTTFTGCKFVSFKLSASGINEECKLVFTDCTADTGGAEPVKVTKENVLSLLGISGGNGSDWSKCTIVVNGETVNLGN